MLGPPRGALFSYSICINQQLHVYIIYKAWISEVVDRTDHLLRDVIAESMTSSFLSNLQWSGVRNLCSSAYASHFQLAQS